MNLSGSPLAVIVTGLLFGFGFAIGQFIWGAIVNVLNRARAPKQ